MEFKIEKEEFAKGLAKIQGIVEKKTTLPVLSNVLIDVKKDRIELSATDLEVGIRSAYQATKIIKTGTVTLPAKRLFEIVRELPQGEIHIIKQDNDWVDIKYANGHMLLSGLPADDFPMIPAFENEGFASFEPDLLAEMIDMTLFAVSTDETRYYLNGIYFEKSADNSLRMVSTDGHRLSMIEKEVPSATKLELSQGVILPRKGMLELKRLLAGAEDSVSLCIRDRNAIVLSKETLLYIRLIDGEFPDYNRVVPTGNEKILEIDKANFTSVLRRISVVSSEVTKGVKLALSKNAIEISSDNPSLGQASEKIQVKYENEDMEIGFNARFFMDILAVIPDGSIRVELSDGLSPALIKTDNVEGFCSVIMPMRL